jgi:chromosome segregation ATPase
MQALKLVEQDQDLQSRAKTAREEQERLEQAAADAQTRHDRAKLEAKRNPSSKTVVDVEVARLQAENARETADAHAASIANLLADATRESARRELDEIQARFSKDEFEGSCSRVRDVIANVRRDLRGALSELRGAVAASNGARSRASLLAQALGEPDIYGAINFDQMLAELIPLRTNRHDGDDFVILRCFSPDGSDVARRIVLEINERFGGDR